jgi:hypothetical protein
MAVETFVPASVDVQSLVFGSRLRWRHTVFLASAQTGHRQETQRFHVPATFDSLSLGLPLSVITNMRVTAEEDDGDIPSHFSDCVVDQIVLFAVFYRDVASDQEEVDIVCPDGVLEPLLLHCRLHRLHDSVICVTVEVEQESKRDDPNALVLGSKLAKPRCQWFQLASFWILDVQIRSDV